MFLSGLDVTDRKIVELLIQNARMSYSDIGEAVGLSRVAVKTRIRSLEERKIIEEYTTIINPQKINGAISCYFEIEMKPAIRFLEKINYMFMQLLQIRRRWKYFCQKLFERYRE